MYIMEKSGFKKFWDNFWYIVWKDESFKGWIISIIFIFIVIKFVFFPVLSLTTGTKLPLAIIESCSMYHQGNLFSDYDSWWTRHETKYSDFQLDKKNFKKFIFNGFKGKGYSKYLYKIKFDNSIGMFKSGCIDPKNKVAKIVAEKYGFKHTGKSQHWDLYTCDKNHYPLQLKEIKSNQLIGKSAFRITPWLGWAKLVLYEPMRSEAERGFCDER